jgi:hypothetical protein
VLTVALFRDLVVAGSKIPKRFLDHACGRDFERNGARFRMGVAVAARRLCDGAAGDGKHLGWTNAAMADRIEGCARTWLASSGTLMSRALGPVLLWSARVEEKRLSPGHTFRGRFVKRRNWSAP